MSHSHLVKIFSCSGTLLLLLFICSSFQVTLPISPSTALKAYLQNGDQHYRWKTKETHQIGMVTAHEIKLTSQQWRGINWVHQLTILAPKKIKYKRALLFITGGSVKEGEPNWKGHDEPFMMAMSKVAEENKALVAILRQTPNQPLYDDLAEDALISYTFHQYKQDQDFSWPLLFPMVKSAVRAMDAIEAFSHETLRKKVKGFVVSGASKRGWTTWLTGSQDERVVAMAPMVIDVLNMPVSLKYHIEAWDDYSIQIEDYVKLGIVKDIDDGESDDLTLMVDPYSYRSKLNMPKMLVLGTNDEYWPVDAVKHYIDDIPGHNLIHYVPNAGHGLGDKTQAINALSAFFGAANRKKAYPVCEENLTATKHHISLSVGTSKRTLKGARFWWSDSDDRDFRDDEWNSQEIALSSDPVVIKNIDYPTAGFIAFYVDLEYEKPTGGVYTVSTRVYVADDDEVF